MTIVTPTDKNRLSSFQEAQIEFRNGNKILVELSDEHGTCYAAHVFSHTEYGHTMQDLCWDADYSSKGIWYVLN